MFNILNKNVIVTGGNRGNGLEISKTLSANGANVIRIDKDFNTSIDADDFEIDLSENKNISSGLDKILNKYSKIDCLINNAGISLSSKNPYEDYDLYLKTIEVNLNSVFFLTSKVCKNMASNGGGSIINILSLGADMAFSNNPSYQISKSGLKQLTKSFAMDWGKHNIRVNGISPGYIITDMTKNSYGNKKMNSQRVSRTMLGRWGEPKDLTGAVIYLISEASCYVTSAEIKVDGGWSSYGI